MMIIRVNFGDLGCERSLQIAALWLLGERKLEGENDSKTEQVD
jgi:hypothetical protein